MYGSFFTRLDLDCLFFFSKSEKREKRIDIQTDRLTSDRQIDNESMGELYR